MSGQRASVFCGVALGLVLALPRDASAAVIFSNGNLTGRWAVHLSPASSFGGTILGNSAGVAVATRQHLARVGYIDWNGAGGASGRSVALTVDNSGRSMTIDYIWSGTYAVNSDGTGTLNVTTILTTACVPDPPPEGGVCGDYVGAETLGFTIGKRYGNISFAQQPSALGAKLFLSGTAKRQNRGSTPLAFNLGHMRRRWKLALSPAMGFASIAPGDPAGVATAGRQDVNRVGYIDWNGIGGASGRLAAVTDDNSGQSVVVNFAWTGAYTIGIDGVGSLTITPAVTDADCSPAQAPGVCASFEAPQTYTFAVSKSRQHVFLMRTDTATSATIFLHGEAELQ